MDKKQLETLTEEELEQFDVVGGVGGQGTGANNVNKKFGQDVLQGVGPGNQTMGVGNGNLVNGVGNYAQGKGTENNVFGKGNQNQINGGGKVTQQS